MKLHFDKLGEKSFSIVEIIEDLQSHLLGELQPSSMKYLSLYFRVP